MLHSFCNNILLLITSFLTHSISQYTRHRHKMKEIFLTLPSSFPIVSIFLSFPFTFSKSGTFSPFLSLSHPAHYHFRRLSSFFSSPLLSLSGHLPFLCLPLVFVCSSLSLSAISFSSYRSLSLTHSLTHSLWTGQLGIITGTPSVLKHSLSQTLFLSFSDSFPSTPPPLTSLFLPLTHSLSYVCYASNLAHILFLYLSPSLTHSLSELSL